MFGYQGIDRGHALVGHANGASGVADKDEQSACNVKYDCLGRTGDRP